jgi:TolB-like protein/Tfp pilus assembly protein PilF
MTNLIAELRRRNVIRVAGLYLVGAWLLVQVASTVLPMYEAPSWLARSIVTALVIGFIPTLVFAWVFELTPDGLKRDAEVPLDQSIAVTTARRMDRLIMVVLAIALAYFGFDRFVLLPQRQAALLTEATRTGAEQATVKARKAEVLRSIAVLPFDNRSGKADQEYYSDGLTDELTTTLSHLSALKVIARTSAARYKASDKSAAQIGRELGVAALVTGSVLRASGKIRYTAELVAVGTQATLWSESYERDEGDIFALQAEVARAIAASISARLSPDESARLANAKSIDPRAFDEYLRGRALWNQRTETSVREALTHFQNATRIAPDFALGFVGVADSYIILGVHGFEPPRKMMPAAIAAAKHAIELDPAAGEPHSSLGDIHYHYDWDWLASEREHKRALELSPASATAYQWGAEPLLLTSGADEAIAFLHRAQELDPLSMIIRAQLGATLAAAGRPEEAISALRDAIALDPNFLRTRVSLSRLLLATGHKDEALSQARQLLAINPRYVPGIATLGLCLGSMGQAGEAGALLAKLDTEGKQRFVSSLERARIAAGLGDRDRTLGYLESAVQAREGDLPLLATFHEFDFLHGDPRYAAIVKAIGIPSA